MINDWGFLNQARQRPYHNDDRDDRVVGIREPKINNRYIDLLELCWEEIHDNGA